MTARALILLTAALCAVLSSCGYIGDPLPPALNIPGRVSDLTAFQRGAKLIIRFTPNFQSADRLTLEKLSAFELRAGPAGQAPFNAETWSAQARAVPVATLSADPVEVETSASDWTGADVIIGVRQLGPTGKPSEWSNLVALKIFEPLEVPSGIAAEPRASSIHLTWKSSRPAPGASWRIYRKAEADPEFKLMGKAETRDWDDTAVEYGAEYNYFVQQVAPAGGGIEAESELSEVTTLKYGDVFPPAVPVGLTVIAGIRTIEVAWSTVPAPDLRGYIVYRASGDQAFAKLGDIVTSPSYTDRSVDPGKSYRYRVSAIDQLGNESAPCGAVEAVAPN